MYGSTRVTVGPRSDKWEDELTDSFPEPFAQEYIASLRFHCMNLRDVMKCTRDDLRELGVRMGHRAKLLEAAEAYDSRMARLDAKEMRQMRRQSSASVLGAFDSMDFTHVFDATSRSNSNAKLRSEGLKKNSTIRTVVTKSPEVEWVDCSGSSPSLEVFLSDIRNKIAAYGFPRSFGRFFLDNKPMPFADAEGTLVVGLLLRLPDLDNPDGTSVTVITNRLVLLLAVDEGLILTYHRCELEMLADFRDTWEVSEFRTADLGAMLEAVLRRALRTYEIAVGVLREAMDRAAGETDEVQAVHKFTLIQKKASIYNRCAKGSINALEDAAAMEHCEGLRVHLKGMCDRLRTVQSLCDELEGNALSSVDLNIALAEFRSSTNLKIFTYITILSQPISVATSWFGMNFDAMNELHNPDAYRIFVPTVLVGSALLCMFLVVRERLLLRITNGVKFKTSLLDLIRPKPADEGPANRDLQPPPPSTAAALPIAQQQPPGQDRPELMDTKKHKKRSLRSREKYVAEWTSIEATNALAAEPQAAVGKTAKDVSSAVGPTAAIVAVDEWSAE